MGVVIGKGAKFYNVPEEILEKYIMPEEKGQVLKDKLKSVKVKMEEADVEGYSSYAVGRELEFFDFLNRFFTSTVGYTFISVTANSD